MQKIEPSEFIFMTDGSFRGCKRIKREVVFSFFIYIYIYIIYIYIYILYIYIYIYINIRFSFIIKYSFIRFIYIYSQVHKYWDIDTILTFLALYTTTMDFK